MTKALGFLEREVLATHDGQWRTIDGAPLHVWVAVASELHEAIFGDHLTRAPGVDWEPRPRERDRKNPAWEITGVPQQLVEAFSSRSLDIDTETDHPIEKFVAAHRRRPHRSTIMADLPLLLLRR